MNKKPVPNKIVAVRIWSTIENKWTRHPATATQGLPETEAKKLIRSFKEVKGEIIPFTPERPVEAQNWLNIDAVRAA